jgi:sortase (surface protein transpeptidase)
MRRSRTLVVRLTPKTTLRLSLRKFRIASQNRTKKHPQLVFPFKVLGYRQIALTLPPRQRRKASKGLPRRRLAYVYALMAVVGLVGIGYFGWLVNTPLELKPVGASAISEATLPANQTTGLPRSVPTELHIPKIGLATPVIRLGLNPNGTVEEPPLNQNVTGWYKFGPTPGQVGPAVIIGHVDTYVGPSVFWRLRELAPGDDISVKRQDGQTVRFKVNQVTQVDKAAFPTQQIYGDIDYPGLRLITCGGTFSPQTGEYSHNTVVFATKI